jgi:hypothetical protein
MSEGIEDINVQLIEFGGENGVQALVKLDKTYRITISNEEIQNSMKDIVPSLIEENPLTQDEMDELDGEVNEQTSSDDNLLKDLNNQLEELHTNFEEESNSQSGGQTLDQVSIALAVALLNNELEDKVKKSVSFAEGDELDQINEFKQSDNKSIITNILENGKEIISSIQSIDEVDTEKIKNHLEDIENEIKDKSTDFPKTQISIQNVKDSIEIIKQKNDISNV